MLGKENVKLLWSAPQMNEIKVRSTEHGTHNQGGANGKSSSGFDDHLMGHAGSIES